MNIKYIKDEAEVVLENVTSVEPQKNKEDNGKLTLLCKYFAWQRPDQKFPCSMEREIDAFSVLSIDVPPEEVITKAGGKLHGVL